MFPHGVLDVSACQKWVKRSRRRSESNSFFSLFRVYLVLSVFFWLSLFSSLERVANTSDSGKLVKELGYKFERSDSHKRLIADKISLSLTTISKRLLKSMTLKKCEQCTKTIDDFFWNVEVWAVQKDVKLVNVVKSCQTSYSVFSIYLQKSASIQPRTSRSKFAATSIPPRV